MIAHETSGETLSQKMASGPRVSAPNIKKTISHPLKFCIHDNRQLQNRSTAGGDGDNGVVNNMKLANVC
jgi:hypothetical protein